MSSNVTTGPNTSSFLQSLAAASTAGTLSAVVPWQSSFTRTPTSDNTFAAYTFSLDEIPGLFGQTRGSLVQHVHEMRCRIRKIPGVNVTYRCIVAALSDFEDPSSFGELDEYLCTYPTARAEFTLSSATTDNTIDLPVVWPIGISTSITGVIPPARVPLIVLYIKADTTLKSKQIVFEFSGRVELAGIGHVAGRVSKA